MFMKYILTHISIQVSIHLSIYLAEAHTNTRVPLNGPERISNSWVWGGNVEACHTRQRDLHAHVFGCP